MPVPFDGYEPYGYKLNNCLVILHYSVTADELVTLYETLWSEDRDFLRNS